MSAGGGTSYSFPLLKPRQIFECLRELHVPVAEDEIRACDPAAVRKVLETFIESTMGVTREDMAQIAFPGLPTLSFPELHSESIPEVTFYRTAQRLLSACGVDDFGLQDVQQPTPKRVRRHLSALINFSKFRTERLAVFSEITGQTDELLTQKKAIQEENAALQRELDQLLEEQKVEEPARVQLQAEVNELEKEINILNRQQAVLRHETDEMKAQRSKMEDEISSTRFTKVEAESEIERLKAQIITSPDRVKGELDTINTTLDMAKDNVLELEEKHRAVTHFIQIYERAEKELANTFKLLEEIEKEFKSCKEAKQKVKDNDKRVEELEFRLTETATRRERLQKLVELKRFELNRYMQDGRVADEKANTALQSAREELSKLEAAHFEVRQRITQNNDASRKLQLKMKEDEAQYQKELKDLEQMYTRLHQAVEYYNQQVLGAIRSSS